MRRIAIVGSLGAMLVFATVALGAVKHYAGKDTDPACSTGTPPPACTITFDGAVRNKKVVKVKNFLFSEIPMTCDQGDYVISNTTPTGDSPLPPMKVNAQRKFKGNFVDSTTSPTQYYHVDGKFSTNYKRATGHFRIHGDFTTAVPPATNCDTGLDTWHTHVG
jgi:hypothetical protein